ncbi:MAG: hypothetical protein IJS39_08320 [Synergistaceae bacterium]|nr:hypothetical protein [Synergistaceae bacterium]
MCDWETYQELEDGSIWSYVDRMENAEQYAYSAYCYEGKEKAAWIVCRLVKEIKTRKKWVDIISCSLDEYDEDSYDYKPEEPDRQRPFDFKFDWIIAEIFPQTIRPDYSREHDRNFSAWLALRRDVDSQREKGIRGRKFLVLVDTINLNEGKFTTYTKVRTIKKYWEPQSAYKETEIVVKVPLPPKDKYIIKAVKEIDDEQAEYIEANRWKLAGKIHEEHISPTLDMFSLPPKKRNDCNERRNHKFTHSKSQSLNVRKRP